MKIAVLLTPEIRNTGNSFINEGGLELLKKCTPSDTVFYYIEAVETSNDLFLYPTELLPEYNRKIIEQCDWLVVFCGSLLSKYAISMFDQLKTLKVKKILLGAGFYENINTELELYKTLPEYFNYIFVRDKESYDALKQEYTNVINFIDLAFWLDVEKYKVSGIEPYTVVNIDSPENNALQEVLLQRYPKAIISRNNPTFTHICNSELSKNYKCFVASRYSAYLKLYSNAEFVATNRVHTFLNCILAKVPSRIFFECKEGYERYFLFKQIGLTPIPGEIYNNYEPYLAKLNELKLTMEDALTNILKT
jgi:exopolysaccharide biosynthesis predicted pyruvyltransferase EpsI